MLYDPKWKQTTTTDPFSLEGLIAWLETQDPRVEYQVNCPRTCAMAQWIEAVSELRENELADKSLALTDPLDARSFSRITFDDPYTFGAALERARAELSKRK